MNEMFTEGARKAIEYARDEAARLKHDYIGTEHLLLGILRLGEGRRGSGALQSRLCLRRQARRGRGPVFRAGPWDAETRGATFRRLSAQAEDRDRGGHRHRRDRRGPREEFHHIGDRERNLCRVQAEGIQGHRGQETPEGGADELLRYRHGS